MTDVLASSLSIIMSGDIEPEAHEEAPSTDLRVVAIAITLTLGNLAICTHRSSRVYMYQQSQCLQHYLAADPSRVNADWEVEESLCKINEVQSPLAIIEGLDTFLQLLPGDTSVTPRLYRRQEKIG